jgi:hypothetical protein
MIKSFDAWVLHRLLIGHVLNGELALMSERFRPLAEQLAALPLGKRKSVVDAFLADCSDADSIKAAVAETNPEEPAPASDEDDEADGWEPIRFGILPPVDPFPLDILPLPVQELAEAAARTISCPMDFPAVAALAAVSGVIGRSASLQIKPGYYVSASLFVALVGSVSSGKSPATGYALKPVWSLSEMLYDTWQAEMRAWEAASPEDRNDEPPVLKRIVTTDPSTEALSPILAVNPRGMIEAPDEMTRWVMSMNQYKGGKGGDRPFYLSAWNGEPVYVDRAKHMKHPIVVPHPFLTVVGGITPDMLSTLSEDQGRDDGFLARLLFAYPDRVQRRRYSEQGIPDDVAADWKHLILALWNRHMRDVDGKSVPHIVHMTPDAAAAWAAWCQAHYDEQETDDFPDHLEGPWGKLEAYAARLALVLHLLHLASDPTRRAPDDSPDLPKWIIADAARLVAYFKSHARRVHAAIGGKCADGGDDVRALVRWIFRNGLTEFSERDISRNFNRFKDDPGALADALGWMTSHNLVRPRQEHAATSKPGRKRSPCYEVNRALKSSPRFCHFRQNGQV